MDYILLPSLLPTLLATFVYVYVLSIPAVQPPTFNLLYAIAVLYGCPKYLPLLCG
jgi:hypothetical protein